MPLKLKYLVLLTFVTVMTSQAVEGQAEGWKEVPPQIPALAKDSALAVYGGVAYAVAPDGKTILERELSQESWSKYTSSIDFAGVTGLSAEEGALFVSDGPTSTVYKIQLSSGNTSILHQGEPLEKPTALTVASKQLYISNSNGSVFRFDLDTGELAAVNLGLELPESPNTRLTSAGNQLIVSNSREGVLLDVSYPSTPERSTLTPYICQDVICPTSYSNQEKHLLPSVLPQIEKVQSIRSPGSIALRDGIIYVVDEDKNQVFATSRHLLRPVRLYSWDHPVRKPSQIALSESSIVILDAATQNIVVWPLLTPTEVVVDVEVSEPMSAVYNYLYTLGILPTRAAHINGSIDRTLRDEKALLSPYVPTLDRVICGLNHKLCKNGSPRPLIPAGTDIAIPDLYSENFIDARPFTLDGKNTLGYEVDHRISSPEFKIWASQERLQALNSQLPHHKSEHLRHKRTGTYIIPIELVRYVAAMPQADLEARNSTLSQIKTKFMQDLTISSLRDRQSVSQQSITLGTFADFANAYQVMTKAIDYGRPDSVMTVPYVGVAEDNVDCDNPDFEEAVCSKLSYLNQSTPQSISARIKPVAPQIRDFDDLDHGTAVTALIGARKTSFKGKGLAAPEVIIIPLRTTDKELSSDITSAYLNDARIFNLSLSFDKDTPDALAEVISENAKRPKSNALFVVAAPDDGRPDCVNKNRYPVCWATQDNVIAVAATEIDGSSLVRNVGNSQWGAGLVQVAAPGTGFGASARNNSYVPLAGTSFAAPLVAATAALLYEEGLRDPRLIKQRIISTSNLKPSYEEKIQGGLLDVRRAVSNLGHGVLVDDDGHEKVVQMLSGSYITLEWPDGRLPSLPIKNLLRLTRNSDEPQHDYTAFYQDPQDGKLRKQTHVYFSDAKQWNFQYKVPGDPTSPSRLQLDSLASYADYIGPILR